MASNTMNHLNARYSFEPNAILRGAQLTLVGAYRALQNPGLFTSEHYKQALFASIGIRVFIRFLGLFTDLQSSSWDEELIEGIEFVEHSVLQVPFFLMSFMRFLSPAMDQMFMASLDWVDRTYLQKHKSEDPQQLRSLYYPSLNMYEPKGHGQHEGPSGKKKKSPKEAMVAFFMRFGRKAALSLGIYLLSFVPVVGRFVLPAASFHTFNKAVGLQPALVVFATGIFLPKRFLVMFLQSYFSSRSLMRELLEPYFSRINYTSAQRKQWFHDRSGVLYGFALAFFVFLKIPLLGVLIYGVAEASTAYLITKITEPPPAPEQARLVEEFKERDVRWVNKHAFLSLPLEKMDRFSGKEGGEPGKASGGGQGQEVLARRFT
nr:hypothetical protein CFP56_19592 [Quercus suber]